MTLMFLPRRVRRCTQFLRVAAVGFAILLPVSMFAQLPAFPGAEGFGKFAAGGRGGTVYKVTNTNDSGPGSFRDAVSVSGRTIIFEVGGVIDYQSPRYAPKPNITIAGQTAPGDGVTIYGNGLSFSGSHNNIVRFLRVRQGINGDSGTDALGIANGHDMIFDHVAVSWGRDETFSVSGDVENITIQSTIISQGLQTHSAGGLIQTDGGVSILRSLYIDNDTRNPKVKFKNEFVNNVVCNWETIGYNMGGDSAGDSYVNMFNNYFIRGPASGSTAIGGGNLNFHIYATNNWLDGNRNGILDGGEMSFASYGSMDRQSTPYPYPITSGYSPLTALKLAISDVGPSFRRDSVDERMITELISWGMLGGTITSELLPPMNGPGIVRNGKPYPDSDNDGMPNFWESGTGSNPSAANNNDPSPSGSGYTRLEDYLNWLAEPHGIALMNTNVVIDLRQFTRGWVVLNRNPFWSVANPTNGTVSLLNGCFALFTPASGWNGPASFQFTVNDNDGDPLTRTMNLFFTPSAQTYKPVWRGDDLANNWNLLGDYNWHDGISLMYRFHNGDAVTFDDTGSTNPAVNIAGSLQPASVTIDAKRHYAFAGSGSLEGSMTLIKTNTGTLTIQNTNGFTGNTIVSNGTILVNGALRQSPVIVRANGSIGGSGILGNGATVFSGGSVVPGNGIGAAGTLTITNGLTLSGGTTNRFDLSDDPTGLVKLNDAVHILGNLNLSGVNTIRVSLLNGLPGNGVYTLFTYTGALNGGLANLTISGVSGTLTNPPGAIAIVVDAQRPPAALVWAGDGASNIWDTGTNTTWLNEGAPDRFLFLDDVLFDDSGSTTPAVNLAGTLTPNSVSVAADVNYTFNGSGRISGNTGLVKTNSGTLTINTVNDFTGPVVIGGGVISVPQLAAAGVSSPLGAADAASANLQLFNSTLRYTGGSVTLNRGAMLHESGGTFEVSNSGANVAWDGTNAGSGALIKSGVGTLTLSAGNSFSGGTVIKAGTVALNGPAGGGTVTANNYGLGSGSVTFQGGTLRLFGNGGSTSPEYGNFSRPMIVPEGETGTLLTPPRYTMSAALSGSGTLNLEVDYVRGTLGGNWSAFNGILNVTGRSTDSEFRIANTAGYAGTTFFLNDNVVITRSGGATTIEIGALNGTSNSRIGPGNSTSGGSSYRVGWKNEDAVFAGRILADGVNTITKVGLGKWTLSGASTYTGGTVVSDGALIVNNISGSGTGTGTVTVNTGATLAGAGRISGVVTVNSGAFLAPGNFTIGSLFTSNAITLAAGSTTLIELNKTAGTKDLLSTSGTLNYGGTLIVTNLSGTLAAGDSFKIFNASTYLGAFGSMTLPPLSAGLIWNTNALNLSGTISVVDETFTGPQLLTWTGDGVLNLWDTVSQNWIGTNGAPRAFMNDDSVLFNDTGANTPAISLVGSLAPAAITVSADQNYTFGGTGSLIGNGRLTKSGSGTLTLANSGANNFTGGTVINGGTLQVGNGLNANGSLTGIVTNNATLTFANPTSVSSPVVIRGPGLLVKSAAGALSFNSAQPYTGPTLINGGSLTFNGVPPAGKITNNASLIFAPTAALTYAGSISGSGGLTINAAQTVTMTGASSYSGGTTNMGATLQISNNAALGSGIVVYSGGQVKVGPGIVVTNDFSIPGSSTSDLSMDTFGNGTAVWAGDVVNLGGSASWRPGGTGGTLVFTGTANQGSRNFIIPRGTVHIASNAVVSATGGATSFGRNTTGNSANVTVRNNASVTLGAFSLGGGQASGGTLTLTIRDNSTFAADTFNLHNSTASSAVTVVNLIGGRLSVDGFSKTRTGANQLSTLNLSGGTLAANAANASFLPALTGTTVQVGSGGAEIDDNAFAITIAAALLHDAALGAALDGGLQKLGSGTLTLSGANTFTGPIWIESGTLAANSPNAINTATNVGIAGNATLNVASFGSFTLANGRKLWGNGTVNGAFTVGNGATLEPGTAGIGRLTFNSTLNLAANSTTRLELSKSPMTNDVVNVLGTAALGGTLVVTHSGAALTAGDSFQLIYAPAYSGSFASVQLPALAPGLEWNTNSLASAGQISVISTVVPSPVLNTVSTSAGMLSVSGADGVPNGLYFVLTSTNAALSRDLWTRLLTNQFDSNGHFSFTNSVEGAQKFFLLELP